MLAFAHRIEMAIENGDPKDYTAVATLLGVTRARISQIVAPITLAPDIQHALLMGTVLHERALHRACTLADWDEQRAAIEGHRHEAEN